MGGCWWHHGDDSHRLHWLDQIQELFLHSIDVCGGRWGQRKWTPTFGSVTENENKIYFDRKPHALPSLFYQGFAKQMPEDPPPPPRSHIPNHPPPHTPPQYDVILEMHEISLFKFSEFKVSLFVTCEKPCKDLFALKFKNFTITNFFGGWGCPQNSLQNQICATALDSWYRGPFHKENIEFVIGKKRCLLYITSNIFSNILHWTWSGVVVKSDWSNVCVESWDFHQAFRYISNLLVAIKTTRVQRQYWEINRMNGDKLKAR